MPELAHEKIVSRKVLERLAFDQPSVTVEDFQPWSSQIDVNRAAGANDVARLNRRSPDEVLREMHREQPLVDDALENGMGGVFDVDLEIAQMATRREHATRHAEQPADVIELVALGEHDAAAKIRTSGVRLPVILVRMCRRQKFPDLHAGAHQFADRASIEQRAHALESRVKAHLVAHERHQPFCLDTGHEIGHAVCTIRQRFFDEQVAAGSHGGEGDRQVASCRIADKNSSGSFCQRLLQVVE